jgi:NhaA family Na+:H+ antiporter
VPSSLKVFLVAFAVMDDLIAIVVIAVFYTAELSIAYLLSAIVVWCVLAILNKYFRIMSLAVYIAGGAVMWVLMYRSGVHATIAGVLLALAIPYSAKDDDKLSPSYKLEDALHRPVAFAVLPIFALANTAIMLSGNFTDSLTTPNSLGIIVGLIAGKPVGILIVSFAAVALGLCTLPGDLNWKHVAGAGMLGGIGFTMSIFITNLAFGGQVDLIDGSKIAVLGASVLAGALGYVWLLVHSGKPTRR